jgi:cold shock CspA family protein
MANKFEVGKVVWFHPEKRYGLISNRWGFDTFFHFNDGRFPAIKNEEVDYGNPKNGKDSLPDPKPGDEVVFEWAKGSNGRDKASPWCYQEMFLDLSLEWERGKELCPNCHDREWDHAGGLCMVNGCHCGDEAYEHDQEEPLNTTPSWSTGPGGQEGYE